MKESNNRLRKEFRLEFLTSQVYFELFSIIFEWVKTGSTNKPHYKRELGLETIAIITL